MSQEHKNFFNNLMANAVWDFIKQSIKRLWSAAVLAALLALWQKAKHGSLDWVAIVGMFAVASFLTFLNFRKPKTSAMIVNNPTAPLGESSARLVLPEDTEVKRLRDEIKQREVDEYRSRQISDQLRAEAREAKDRVAELKQENSTLQGRFSLEKERLLNDKANAGNEALRLEAELKAITTSLEFRTFALCREIRAFIKEIGPKPTIDKPDQNSLSEFVRSGKFQEWKNRYESGYRKRFAARLIDLRNELQEHGQQDNELDTYVFSDEFVADTRWLEIVVKDLIVLAGNLL